MRKLYTILILGTVLMGALALPSQQGAFSLPAHSITAAHADVSGTQCTAGQHLNGLTCYTVNGYLTDLTGKNPLGNDGSGNGPHICLDGTNGQFCTTANIAVHYIASDPNSYNCPSGQFKWVQNWFLFINIVECEGYSINVWNDKYQLEVKATTADYSSSTSQLNTYPQSLDIRSQTPLTVSNNVTLPLTLPLHQVNVHVQDNGGTAISNIPLDASAPTPQFNNNGSLKLLDGVLTNLTLTNGGQNYQYPVSVTIAPPFQCSFWYCLFLSAFGRTAKANATINGSVTQVNVNNVAASDCYSLGSTVNAGFTDDVAGDGSGAAYQYEPVGSATNGVTVNSGGSYSNNPTGTAFTFSSPTGPGNGNSTASGIVTSASQDPNTLQWTVTGASVTFGGFGYIPSALPTATISGGASFTASLTYAGLVQLAGAQFGSGYHVPPTVSIPCNSNLGATPASATAIITGPIDSVTLTDGGFGYFAALNANPTITFTGANATGQNATAAATVGLPATGISKYDHSRTGALSTDGSGNATMYLLASSIDTQAYDYTFNANPDPDADYGPGQSSLYVNPSSVTENTVTIVLPKKVIVSGQVFGENGTTLANGVTVCLDADTTPPPNVTAGTGGEICSKNKTPDNDAAQNLCPVSNYIAAFNYTYYTPGTCTYAVKVVPGAYTLKTKASAGDCTSSCVTPQNFTVLSTDPLIVTAATNENITLPFKSVAVKVVKSDGFTPSPGIPIDASSKAWQASGPNNPLTLGTDPNTQAPLKAIGTSSYTGTDFSGGIATGATTTDTNGNATIFLLRSSGTDANSVYTITAHPAFNIGTDAPTSVAKAIVGDVVTPPITIRLTHQAVISGQITDADGTPMDNVFVSAETVPGQSQPVASTRTAPLNGQHGIYFMPAPAGDYYLKVSTAPGNGQTYAPQTMTYETPPIKVGNRNKPTINLVVDQLETFNLQLPLYQVDTHVTANAVNYSGATIDAASACPLTGLSAGGGIARLVLSNPGTGYVNIPDVTISDSGGGTGTGATALALFNQSTHTITGLEITNSGSGYSNPTVTITPKSGGPGSGATATAALLTGATGCSSYATTTNNQNVPNPTISDANGNATLFLLRSSNSGGSNQPYTFTAEPPPSDHTYVPTTVANQTVNQDMTVGIGNAVQIALVTPKTVGGTVTVSDNGSYNVQGVTVSLLSQPSTLGSPGQTQPSAVVTSAVTDQTGAFTFPQKVTPGDYFLQISAKPGDGQTNAPQSFTMESKTASLHITDDTTLSLVLPLHKVNVTTQDTGGTALDSVPLDAKAGCQTDPANSGTFGDDGQTYTVGGLAFKGCALYDSNASLPTVSDLNGAATLWLLDLPKPGYNLTAHPPVNSTYLTSTLNGVAVSADVPETMQLAHPITYSGRLAAADGENAEFVHVGVESVKGGGPIASGVTDSGGSFNFTGPSGTYYLKIWSSPTNSIVNIPTNVPQTLSLETTTKSLYETDTAFGTLSLPYAKVGIQLGIIGQTAPLSLSGVNFDIKAQTIGAHPSTPNPAETGLTGGNLTYPLTFNGSSSYIGARSPSNATNGGGHSTVWLLYSTLTNYKFIAYPPKSSHRLQTPYANVPIPVSGGTTQTPLTLNNYKLG